MRTRVSNISAPRSLAATSALVALALALVPAWLGRAAADSAKPRASFARQHITSHRSDARRHSHVACRARGATRRQVGGARGTRQAGGARGARTRRCSNVAAARASHGKSRKLKSTPPTTTTPATPAKLPRVATPPRVPLPLTTTPPTITARPTTGSITALPAITGPSTTESITTLSPTSSPGTGTGWDGFGGLSQPGADWRPYASTSPFNTTTEGVAVDPDSAAYVQKALSWGLPGNLIAGNAETTSDYGHPTFYAEPTDPIYTLHATATQNSPIEGMKIPIPNDAKPAGGSDGHMTVVTPDGWEYDFWQVQSKPSGGGTLTFSMGGRTRIDGNGLGSSATASDFGNLAGMIRAPELAAGRINHALFIVLKCAAKGTSFGYGTTARLELEFELRLPGDARWQYLWRRRTESPAARHAFHARDERRTDPGACGAGVEEDDSHRARSLRWLRRRHGRLRLLIHVRIEHLLHRAGPARPTRGNCRAERPADVGR